MLDKTEIVQQAEETEQELIEKAAESVSQSSWVVGECAHKWTQRYSRGRTDEEFGKAIGLSGVQVQQRRQVFALFGDIRKLYPGITFSHFRVALAWPDAEECLAWAVENKATYKEMTAWRRMQNGEDLTPTESEPVFFEQEPDPDPPPAPPTINKAPVREPADDFRPAKRNEEKRSEVIPFSPHAVTPEKPQNGTPIESRSFTLDELRRLIVAAEDTSGDAREAKKLAEWHRARADELDPPDSVTPASAIVAEWNMIPDVARCARVTPKRNAAIQARMKDPFWRENWREAMQKVSESAFCKGDNDRGWIATIEWFLRPETVINLMEGGKYGNNGNLNANLERFLEQV